MKKAKTILDLITKTPIKHLSNVYRGPAKIWAKLEFVQPGGSVKDRAAYACITGAIKKGILKPGQTVTECTSGNMGAGLAVVCRALGHPFIAFMSAGNSAERRKIMRAFGAIVNIVPQVSGTPGMVTGEDI
jgi:cysteine synthase A